MKRFIALPFALALLVGCTKSASSDNSNAQAKAESSTTTAVAATTSTIAALKNPDSGEKAIACDNKAISASYGEKVKAEKCTATWAMGDTDTDSWNCPKEGCNQTRIFHFVNNKWTNTATCQRSLPLTRYKSTCYIPNVGAATLAELPPADVACAIWSANNLLRYVTETGCNPSAAEINAQFSSECTGYTAAATLPLEKCDTGAAVKTAQKKLKEAGYNTNVDGFFGPSMAKAVYEYQGAKSLIKTGLIDDATWNSLVGTNFAG